MLDNRTFGKKLVCMKLKETVSVIIPIPLHYLPPSADFKPPKEYLPTVPEHGNIGESGLPDPPPPDSIPTLPDVEAL